MKDPKDRSGPIPDLKFILRGSLLLVGLLAILLASVALLPLILGWRPMSERLIGIVEGVFITVAAGVVLVILEHWLAVKREKERTKNEQDRTLRATLIEPARRELSRRDVDGGHFTGQGPDSLPSMPVDDLAGSYTAFTEE